VEFAQHISKDLWIPRERFTTAETLAGGANGIVKKGTFGRQQTPVAVKQVALFTLDIGKGCDSVCAREVEILCKLRHPHCITFYGVSQVSPPPHPPYYVCSRSAILDPSLQACALCRFAMAT
jgi:hypothetical protein